MTVTASDESRAVALCGEGAALFDAGDHTAAISRYRRATELAPSMLALHLVLANAQRIANDTRGARASLQVALDVAARPTIADEFELGRALVDAGAGAHAVRSFRRVSDARPRDAGAAAALAAALRDAQQPDAAWAEVTRALTLSPNDPVALHTAALIRHDLADYAAALALCEQSLRLRPDSNGTRMTRGYLRQLLGDARGGWRDFESRPLPHPGTGAQEWKGESLLGKSILLLGEQGVGDQFQCVRFALHPSIRAARRVIIGCQPDAVTLLQAAGFEAVSRHSPVVTDYFVPLLSLPDRLDIGAHWQGETSPYLALPDLHPSNRGAGFHRIGVVWSGNPAHRNDAVRSIPVSLVATLPDAHPDLSFVCLQHETTAHDAMSRRWEHPESGDWLATARQLCTLDVLITVDTGIAHLAGALGVPVWILLPHVPDWRWGVSGSSSAWYASARLIRQESRGDWAEVLVRVSQALRDAAPA